MKPRVLSAVLRLQTFTAQEIVSAANLTGRKQAYAQLEPLEKDGLIFSVSTPDHTTKSRPTKLYRVSQDREALQTLAKRVAEYGLIPPAEADFASRNAALNRGSGMLAAVESEVGAMEPSKLDRGEIAQASSRIEEWSRQLDQIDTELETATIEAAGTEDSDGRISSLGLRLREARKSIQEMVDAIRMRQAFLEEIEMVALGQRGLASRRVDESELHDSGTFPLGGRHKDVSPEALVQIGILMEQLKKADLEVAWVVDMHYFSGFTQEEIAKISALTLGQVRHRLEKGRDFLKDRLAAASWGTVESKKQARA